MEADSLPDELGYRFTAPDYRRRPDQHELVIQIHEQPTYRHFDPEHVILNVFTQEGHADRMTVRHPWTFGEAYRGYLGRIHMIDRTGKEAHAFSFGGDWEIQNQDKQTHLKLVSQAPILPCSQSESMAALLAEEVEILIAEQGALQRSLGIEKDRQACCDPLQVYAGCLQALAKKYEKLGSPTSQTLLEFHQFLIKEIERLQDAGQWPIKLPDLAELF